MKICQFRTPYLTRRGVQEFIFGKLAQSAIYDGKLGPEKIAIFPIRWKKGQHTRKKIGEILHLITMEGEVPIN